MLARHGLCWDGDILWQHDRLDAYRAALDQLRARGLVYACRCSRRDLTIAGRPDCLGPCRDAGHAEGAWRLRGPDAPVDFHDRRLGDLSERLADTCGDIVLWRRDGLPSYQLAVVVDDDASGVTDVVRGADLLDNTARQCWLQTCLGLPRPRYLHLPLVLGADGRKLSKQSHARPLDPARASENIAFALRVLGQDGADASAPPAMQLAVAAERWDITRLPVTGTAAL